MNPSLYLPALLVILLLNDLQAGLPVTEDGPQLTYIQSLAQLTSQIQGDQSLSQQHLAKIRAMEEGSKAVSVAMAQMDSLVKHGQLLNANPDGASETSAANGLTYNGSSFSGGNYQFIDNLVGQNGPIALDRILPTTLIPVSGGLLQQAQQSVASFASSSSSSLLNATSAAILGSMPSSSLQGAGGASQLVAQFLQSSGSGQSGMMADGVFLRPYSGAADDAYQALVENGTSAQKLQFFADSTLGGGGYQAILGSTNNAAMSMVNMDNLLSAGASQAVQSYLQSNAAAGSNPYQGYANQLLTELPSLMSQAAPGTFLVPSSLSTSSAQQIPPASGGNNPFPSLFSGYAAVDSTPTLVSATPFGIPATSEDESNAQGVVAVTPTAAEAQAYEGRITESDQRLRGIVQELKTEQQAEQYNQQIVQSLQAIQEQAQGIQQSLNTIPANSIPQLTTLIRDIQGDIEARQQVANSMTLSVESLQQQLHSELANRAEIVSQEQKAQAAQALPRWRSALATSAST